MATTATKERPILFSGEMVRAILSGGKTQTRRVVKQQPLTVDPAWFNCSGPVLCVAKSGNAGACDLIWGGPTCPYGVPGDRLWVRETFGEFDSDHYHEVGRPKDLFIKRACQANGVWHPARNAYYYKADCVTAESEQARLDYRYKYKTSIHMPRRASRITLEVTDVRVQRVQDISDSDIRSEGLHFDFSGERKSREKKTNIRRHYFRESWDKINGKRPGCSWADNPWVWAVTFQRPE